MAGSVVVPDAGGRWRPPPELSPIVPRCEADGVEAKGVGLRILVFCPTFGTLGGIERKAEALVSEFRRQGHVVAVLARGPRGRGVRDGVVEFRLPFRNLPSAPHRLARRLRFRLMFPLLLRATRRIIDEWGPDVILTLAVSPYTPYTAAMAALRPLVFCVETAGPDLLRHPASYRHALTAARAVVACASSLADEVRGMAPEAAHRIGFIPNGVDVDRFAPGMPPADRGRPYVLGVGRLDRQKGFDLLLEAMALIRDPDAPDLVLAGDGPERTGLETQAERLGLNERVRLLGACTADEVAALYRGAAVVAIPSRWEGLPLVCLEALASGAAVVAARVDGLTDVVRQNETGLLVPPDDITALTAAIICLLRDPARRKTLGASGRATIESEFAWPVIARRYLHLLDEVHRGRE